ncbi:MAG: S8 family peptidase [Paludibacter sp.]|nr:S8 family peptidase [Paludibacter sp.]
MAQSHEHIFLQGVVKSEKFTTTLSGGGKLNIPERDRIPHSQYLISRFDSIRQQSIDEKQEREAMSLPTHQGTYLEFKSGLNSDLITKSLENINKGIRLLSVRTVENDGVEEIKAIVYIPQGKEAIFIEKIQDYANDNKNTPSGNPKNAPLVNSIEDVQLALLESFWSQQEKVLIPNEQPTWCEVWLRIDDLLDFNEQVSSFTNILQELQISFKGSALQFPERAVLLIYANRVQLTSLISATDLLAEFRIGQEAASFWINESNIGQIEWAQDLLNRLQIEETNIKVCILDSGVNNGHMLLLPIIDDANCLTVDPSWRTDDRSEIVGPNGHGTLMAGLVEYGNLQRDLESKGQVILTHKLCSVKILPNVGQSRKEHWGDITEQAVYRAEARNPEQVLLFCMAVTSKTDVDKGRPSSWSGAIDIMSYGKARNQRLFIISAGNVPSEYWSNYPKGNQLFSVQNPAQSWNALTIGAFTEKVLIKDSRYDHLERVAQIGEISPYSSTSNLWDKKWPIKPEVLFEGGNLVKRGENLFEGYDDLELLSTSKHFNIRQFDTINATSAATAEASWLAAKIQYIYPNAWPETIRALIVHSASWTEQMIQQFDINLKSKAKEVRGLLRTCGYGVPDINRALYSFENGLTFVAQETIQPYIKENGSYKTNEMHFFDLPWPTDLLTSLGETPVRFRITLSYFIEPGAGEIGWKDKYRYQSYGLRFEINNINETEDEFKKRINKDAREDDDDKPDTNSGSGRWVIGKNNRDVGSIHSDIWEGTASEMAECNLIAIYPIIGWWRERHNLRKYNARARYSLVVSLDTPAETVELYSTVKAMIQIPIEIVMS